MLKYQTQIAEYSKKVLEVATNLRYPKNAEFKNISDKDKTKLHQEVLERKVMIDKRNDVLGLLCNTEKLDEKPYLNNNEIWQTIDKKFQEIIEADQKYIVSCLQPAINKCERGEVPNLTKEFIIYLDHLKNAHDWNKNPCSSMGLKIEKPEMWK